MSKYLPDTLMETVRQLLINVPSLRDDDKELAVFIWSKEIGPEIATISASNFLCHYMNGDITAPGSITRARRKLQEEDKTLRGEKWYKRKGRAEEVKQEIINFKYE